MFGWLRKQKILPPTAVDGTVRFGLLDDVFENIRYVRRYDNRVKPPQYSISFTANEDDALKIPPDNAVAAGNMIVYVLNTKYNFKNKIVEEVFMDGKWHPRDIRDRVDEMRGI